MVKAKVILIVWVFAVVFYGSNLPAMAQDAPQCFSNQDCVTQGEIICQDAGTPMARCAFQEAPEVSLIVITSKDCQTCRWEPTLNRFKRIIPKFKTTVLDKDDAQAQELMRRLDIKVLPAYLFSSDIDKVVSTKQLNNIAELKNEYYYVRPDMGGVSYFPGRIKRPRQLDLFILITQENTSRVLDLVENVAKRMGKDVFPLVHFVALHDSEDQKFLSPGGFREINEGKLFACVEEIAPGKSWDYLKCRVADLSNPFAEDCLEQLGLKVKEIKKCVKSPEANRLFARKIQLAEELKVLYAPLLLMENVEIVGITAQTTADEITKFLHPPQQNIKPANQK